jgi:hypothetical protein
MGIRTSRGTETSEMSTPTSTFLQRKPPREKGYFASLKWYGLSAGSDSRRVWTGLNYLAQGALNLMFASAIGALRSGFSLSGLTSSRLGCSKKTPPCCGSSTSFGSRTGGQQVEIRGPWQKSIASPNWKETLVPCRRPGRAGLPFDSTRLLSQEGNAVTSAHPLRARMIAKRDENRLLEPAQDSLIG